MPIPDYQTLMLPVLRVAAAGEMRVGAAVDVLATEMGLTAGERAELLPSGRQTLFANRVHWAKTYVSKAGLIESTRRGYFRITPRGRQVLQASPIRIDNSFLSQFDEFQSFKIRSRVAQADQVAAYPDTRERDLEADADTPDEIMRRASQQIEAALGQDLLDRIRAAPAEFFERLIVTLLLRMGYGGSTPNAARVLGRSGDDGVDGGVDQDALGLDRVYIQAKRYAAGNAVGSGAIRDFFGSLDRHKAAKGLFVTTSTFSRSARDTADLLSKRIVLIDGERLALLMIRHDIGCRIEETLYVKKLDEDFFE